MYLLLSEATVVVFVGIVIISFVVYMILKNRDKGNTPPRPPKELPLSDDVYNRVDMEDIKANQKLIVGNDQTLIVLVNDEIQHKDENYIIECNNIIPFMNQQTSSKSLEEGNEVVNLVRVYRVKRSLIENVDFAFTSPIQYFDPLFKILLKLKLSLQASFNVTNIQAFMKYFERNKSKMSRMDFKDEIGGFIEAKLYGIISSYVTDKNISYLHISLYKYEIEQELIEELNEFLSKFGLTIEKLVFTQIENIKDDKFKVFAKNILEKSKMEILQYSYKDRMNRVLQIIEEEVIEEKRIEKAQEEQEKPKGFKALFK